MSKPSMESDVLLAALAVASERMNVLTTEELKEVLNDDGRIESIVADMKLSNFKHLDNEKERLMASNRSLAELNLAKQPQLEEGKSALRELGDKGTTLSSSVREKFDEIKEKSGSMSVDSALELLQAAAAEIEEESENLAEKFLAGDYGVDEFLEQFLTRRKLMHLRKVKVDKMRELRRKAGMKSQAPVYPPASNFPGMVPGGVPYPTGPIGGMPMPILPQYRPY